MTQSFVFFQVLDNSIFKGLNLMLVCNLQDKQIQKMHDKKQQQAIMMKLHSYDVQQSNDENVIQMLQTYHKSNIIPFKSHSFRQVSDWANRYQQKVTQLKLNTRSCQKILNATQQEDKDKSKRQTYLYIPKKFQPNIKPKVEIQEQQVFDLKRKVELSPIIMRFDQSKAKHQQQRRRYSSVSKKQQNISVYDLNYQPLSLLYEMKTKQKDAKQSKSKPIYCNKQEELPVVYPHAKVMRYPKTERISSILRALKKNQQKRIIKQNLGFNDEQKWLLKQ